MSYLIFISKENNAVDQEVGREPILLEIALQLSRRMLPLPRLVPASRRSDPVEFIVAKPVEIHAAVAAQLAC